MRSRILNIIPILLVLTALNAAHAQQARKPSKRVLIGTVHFRPPTIWQQYRGYVIGAAGLVAFQTAMIAGLLLLGLYPQTVLNTFEPALGNLQHEAQASAALLRR